MFFVKSLRRIRPMILGAKRPKWRRRGGQSKVDGLKELDIFCCLGEVKFLKTLEYYPPVHFNCKMRGLVFSKKWVSGVIFLVPHARRALVFFSRKHFWHSLKKHVVGFKLVFKNQSSFFSETSSLNPINIQELNRPFFSKCSWEGKAKKEQFIHLLFFSFNIHLFFLFTCIFFSFCFFLLFVFSSFFCLFLFIPQQQNAMGSVFAQYRFRCVLVEPQCLGKEKVVINVYFTKANPLAVGDATYAYF